MIGVDPVEIIEDHGNDGIERTTLGTAKNNQVKTTIPATIETIKTGNQGKDGNDNRDRSSGSGHENSKNRNNKNRRPKKSADKEISKPSGLKGFISKLFG